SALPYTTLFRSRLVSYDDLAADPVPGFRDLYEYAGLRWSPAAERRIVEACTGTPATTGGFAWSGLSRTAFRPMDSRLALRSGTRGLTDEEITRVKELTAAP